MRNKKIKSRLLLILFVLIGLLFSEDQFDGMGNRQTGFFFSNDNISIETGNVEEHSGSLIVHYLDMEKCNCVLVESGDGHFMLIDAGSNDDTHTAETVEYLRKQGVRTLDYLILTHPHMDHIRSVPEIVNRFSVNEVLMGDFSQDLVGTQIYVKVLDAVWAKDILQTSPNPGEMYQLGNASFTILANDDSVQTSSEDLNNSSVALMLTDGRHKFFFYGDGEEAMEEKLQDSGFDLKADVLMIAHHGSSTSSGQALLETVRPAVAVIPCGIDMGGNRQIPADSVLDRLQKLGIAVYRSDENGTVVIESKEEGLRVMTEK